MLSIRPVGPADVSVLFSLVRSLADYEKLLHEVVGNEALLHEHLFGETPVTEALLAEWEGQVAGFALFFPAYSTHRAEHGIYLEDLFVLPDYRRKGIGKAILAQLSQIVLERQGSFLSWCVLDWNHPAIAFYESLGTHIDPHRRICRVTGDAIQHLAQQYQSTSAPVQALTADTAPAFAQWLQPHLDLADPHRAALQEHLAQNSEPPTAFAVYQEHQIRAGLVTYTTYSTFLTRPGFFVTTLTPALDDPHHTGQLLSYLAQQALNRGYGRLEWALSSTDDGAIAHYSTLGATLLEDWRFCRLDGDAMASLAAWPI